MQNTNQDPNQLSGMFGSGMGFGGDGGQQSFGQPDPGLFDPNQ